jgi:hypothetical protein
VFITSTSWKSESIDINFTPKIELFQPNFLAPPYREYFRLIKNCANDEKLKPN